MPRYIGALDQGTTSTRFIVFDYRGQIVARKQMEHRQIYPRPGWVEHDPLEIWDKTQRVISGALNQARIPGSELAAIGVTNQRETVLVWDRHTGRPYYNALVWQCLRTEAICRSLIQAGGQDRFREQTGLPVATYFSGPKIKWILDRVPEARRAAERGDALFGTMETWLIWWLTGGPREGAHVTDVTNASRTMLMDLRRLDWEDQILSVLGIPRSGLARIVPSSDQQTWGTSKKDGPLGAEVPICGAVGDQQAALVGQVCFEPGEAKNTYGTGCFLLLHTGNAPVPSKHGLLSTVAYQLSGQDPAYCLEGSIAIAGSLVQWLRDNLRLLDKASEIEALATGVNDTGGVYVVPAFSGLFAPHWRFDARGVIVGLTHYTDRRHLARAALEATAYQTRDIVQAMDKDAGLTLKCLKVDGGMVDNGFLMQFQSDILGVPVIRPQVTETTSLGAAYLAGIAVGFWSGLGQLRRNWAEDQSFYPSMSLEVRQRLSQGWQKAVQRTFGWLEDQTEHGPDLG